MNEPSQPTSDAGDPTSDNRRSLRFELAVNGILVLDAETGRIVDANPALLAMVGRSRAELVGRLLWDVDALAAVAADETAFRRLLADDPFRRDDVTIEGAERRSVDLVGGSCLVGGRREVQIEIRDVTTLRALEDEIRRTHEELTKLVAESKRREDDMARLRRTTEMLREQAMRDPLTGLFNRRFLEDTLGREFHRSRRTGTPLCVAMLDLDHFKQFNDTFGHEAGDALLRAVGGLLREKTRRSDVVCRFGGEEFIVIFPDSTLEDTAVRVEQIRTLIKGLKIGHAGLSLGEVTVSAGIASSDDASSESELMRGADDALYAAKLAGRDRVATFVQRT